MQKMCNSYLKKINGNQGWRQDYVRGGVYIL